MVLFVLRNHILQTRTRSHPMRLDVWFFVGPVFNFHTLCVWTAKALVRLRGCAGSPEPSLVAYMISTTISCAGWNRPTRKTVDLQASECMSSDIKSLKQYKYRKYTLFTDCILVLFYATDKLRDSAKWTLLTLVNTCFFLLLFFCFAFFFFLFVCGVHFLKSS